MKKMQVIIVAGAIAIMPFFSNGADAAGQDKAGGQGSVMLEPGLKMPKMDAAHGRRLFASKGCVVCHSINGVGGEDAPKLDASTMPRPMNPFEFAAKMWRGAEAMVAMQRDELGQQIELNGDELADIIAFVHDPKEQKTFSESEIPERIRNLMEHEDEGDDEHHGMEGRHMGEGHMEGGHMQGKPMH